MLDFKHMSIYNIQQYAWQKLLLIDHMQGRTRYLQTQNEW